MRNHWMASAAHTIAHCLTQIHTSCGMSRTHKSQVWHIRISHGKHICNHGMAEAARAESCHKFEWDMSHTHTNHITRMYASCHTHVWVNIAQPWNGRGRACGQHHCGKPLDAWAAGSRFAQAVTPQFAAAFLPVGVRSLVLCVQRCMWLYLICVTLLVV